MAVDVTSAFAAYTAGNRGPTATDPEARERPEYGLAATIDRNVLELTLTFRTGKAYCCGEWQCHFMLFPTRRWDSLRQALALGESTERLELRIEVIVEEGALFLLPRRRSADPPGLLPSKGFRYRASVTEAEQLAEPPDFPA